MSAGRRGIVCKVRLSPSSPCPSVSLKSYVDSVSVSHIPSFFSRIFFFHFFLNSDAKSASNIYVFLTTIPILIIRRLSLYFPTLPIVYIFTCIPFLYIFFACNFLLSSSFIKSKLDYASASLVSIILSDPYQVL